MSDTANSTQQPLLGISHGQLHHAHMGFVPPPGPADVQITPQMIFSNINDTNQSLQRLELSMHERLSKLDMLDTLNLKLEHFEKNIVTIKTEIDNIKATQKNSHKYYITRNNTTITSRTEFVSLNTVT